LLRQNAKNIHINLECCHRWLRACPEHFEGKQIAVEQASPWPPSRTAPYTDESTPSPQFKAHEWIVACGELCTVAA
jgi:hypothetical protein